jgi:hypothetical protein
MFVFTQHKPMNNRELHLPRAVFALGLAAILTACGGVRLRSPISTGSEPAVTQPSSPPQTFIHSTADAKSTRVLDVRDGLKKDVLFKTASDMLAQKYTIDVSDPSAGFLMTTWQSSVVQNGVPDLRYRTRVVIRFLGAEWKQVSVRAEANWQRGDEWDVGYDVAALEAVSAELRSVLGKRVE